MNAEPDEIRFTGGPKDGLVVKRPDGCSHIVIPYVNTDVNGPMFIQHKYAITGEYLGIIPESPAVPYEPFPLTSRERRELIVRNLRTAWNAFRGRYEPDDY